MPVFIGALDLTVVSAVLPQVVYDLQIPLRGGMDQAAWVVSGYLLAYTIAMTFMGRLSDLWGRRRIYLLSLTVFAAGSLLVAVADGQPARWLALGYRLLLQRHPDPAQMALWALIAGRMVQAFGGGAMVPVSMALAGDLYPPLRRAAPLGFIGAVDTAGWVVGHLYGGIVVRYASWRMIFWLNLPICLLAFVLAAWALRRLPAPRAEGKFDGLGAALAAAALAALTLGLGQSATEPGGTAFSAQAPPEISWPLLGVAAGCLAVFVALELRQRYPLVPVRLFGNRNFSAAAVVNFLAGFSLVIAIANVPLFINTLVAATLQQGAWDSGWMLSGLTLPMAAAALLGGWATPRVGYRATAGLGLVLAMAGFALMAGWRAATPYSVMLGHLALAGVGLGLVIAPVATAVVNAAAPEQRGAASALVIIFRLCGMTLGLAAMTTYDLRRADALLNGMATADLARLAAAGMDAMNRVINETFWLAALVCALALVPALLLGADHSRSTLS